jgi:hypothetical protein
VLGRVGKVGKIFKKKQQEYQQTCKNKIISEQVKLGSDRNEMEHAIFKYSTQTLFVYQSTSSFFPNQFKLPPI